MRDFSWLLCEFVVVVCHTILLCEQVLGDISMRDLERLQSKRERFVVDSVCHDSHG